MIAEKGVLLAQVLAKMFHVKRSLVGDYPAVDTEPEIVVVSAHHGQEEKAASDTDREAALYAHADNGDVLYRGCLQGVYP